MKAEGQSVTSFPPLPEKVGTKLKDRPSGRAGHRGDGEDGWEIVGSVKSLGGREGGRREGYSDGPEHSCQLSLQLATATFLLLTRRLALKAS